MKTIIGIFLVLHGLVHIGIALAPGRDGRIGTWLMDPHRLWLFKSLGIGEAAMRQTGMVFMVLATAAFVLAGIAWFLPGAWFAPVAMAASIISLLFLGIFWHPWLVVGLALDLAVLLAVALKWTPALR